MRFFKKLVPQTEVTCANGSRVRFETNDGLTGYFQTDNPYLHSEFEKCMTEQRYGISEINEEEYKVEYLEKKTPPEAHKGSWREEMSLGARKTLSSSTPVSRLGSDAVAAAVAVNGVSDVPKSLGGATMTTPAPAKPGSKPDPTQSRTNFQPPTGKRKPRNQ
jgi:hypothetical protein